MSLRSLLPAQRSPRGQSQATAAAGKSITGGGLISGERSMWDANKERGTLELRHKEILARIDILNQLNTQSMLVAGCAVASLGGESLQVVDDETENVLGAVVGALFAGTTAITLTSSLWVIFISTHLIELSQQSALHGKLAQDITEADHILEERMRDVRMFYIVALASLLASSLFMVWINMSLANSAAVTAVFVLGVMHAGRTRAETRAAFMERTSLDCDLGRSFGDLFGHFVFHTCLMGLPLFGRGAKRGDDASGTRGYEGLVDDGDGDGGDPRAGAAPAGGGDEAMPCGSDGGSTRSVRATRRLSASSVAGPPAPPQYYLKGWLAKVASGSGPLRHVPHDQLGSLASVRAPDCKDRRYVVLSGGQLSWWKHEEEHTLMLEPQTTLAVAEYVAIEAPGQRDAPAIALVPRAVALALQQTPPPIRIELPSGTPKSWYFQASTPAETKLWIEAITGAAEESRS